MVYSKALLILRLLRRRQGASDAPESLQTSHRRQTYRENGQKTPGAFSNSKYTFQIVKNL
eukprot:UN15666